jgi:leucyl/phenylalanyl-tRNA--protein transferase
MKHRETTFDPQRPTAALLLLAYRQGVFPMADPIDGAIDWLSPDPRGVIPLESFHAPVNLQREVRRGIFDIRCDSDFSQVIRACAQPRPGEPLSWINEPLIRAYVSLYHAGHAHSIEAWRDGAMVGGLYGVHIGAAFFGESMFSLPHLGGSNASKVCLVHLVRWLRLRGFTLLDTQFVNDHLLQFGCVEISRSAYLQQLAQAVARDVTWGDFSATRETT